MAQKLAKTAVAEKATIHADLPKAAHRSTTVDRTFELPTALLASVAGLFLVYLAIMTMAFGNPHLALPMVMCVISVIAGFGIPSIWARMQPAKDSKAKSWSRFMSEGVQTYTGRIGAGAAMVQVLILPVLILVWGLAVVTIAALV